MTEIAPELVERMVALVREIAADRFLRSASPYVHSFAKIAADIVAELPEPVDPDLIEVRKMLAERYDPEASGDYIRAILAGKEDYTAPIINCLAAIKRGRELERSK